MNKVGETIKEILKKTGKTQVDLCVMTGIKPAAMSKYLSGEKMPRTEILMKIADALNVSLYTLLGQDDERSVYEICRSALLARSGKKLTEDERKELIKLILGD
ncbi:MAG: helix-turn-helix transcriptional regulator [Solobacterium sp.]|nr:helix-turn-helix transcriptional regulator [Solobacterium sp.]